MALPSKPSLPEKFGINDLPQSVKAAMPGYKAVYPEAVDKRLKCAVCKLVLRNAMQLTRDGTLLCKTCYEQRYATVVSCNRLKLHDVHPKCASALFLLLFSKART